MTSAYNYTQKSQKSDYKPKKIFMTKQEEYEWHKHRLATGFGEEYLQKALNRIDLMVKEYQEEQEYRALKTKEEKEQWIAEMKKNFDHDAYEARMLEKKANDKADRFYEQIFHYFAVWTKNYTPLTKVFSKSEVTMIGKLEQLQRLANKEAGLDENSITEKAPFMLSWNHIESDINITLGTICRTIEMFKLLGLIDEIPLTEDEKEHNKKVHFERRIGRRYTLEYDTLENFLQVCKSAELKIKRGMKITEKMRKILVEQERLKEHQTTLKREMKELRFWIKSKAKLTKEGRADEYKYGLENSIKTITLIVDNLDKKENIITQEVTPAPVETQETQAPQAPQQKNTFEKTHDKEKDRDMDGMQDNQAFRAMGLKPQVSAMLEIAKNSDTNDKIKGIMPRDIFNKIRLKTEEDYKQQAENLKDDMRFQNEKEIQENGLKRFAPTAEYYFELFDFFLEDFKEFYNTYKYEFETSTGRPVCIRKLYYYFKHQFLKDKSSGTPFRVCNDYLFFTELTKGKRLMAHPDYIFEETNYYRDYKGICRTALQGGYDPDNEKLNELYNQIREGFKNMEQHDRRRVRKWADITQDFVTMGEKGKSIINPRYQAQYDKVLQKQEELRKKD